MLVLGTFFIRDKLFLNILQRLLASLDVPQQPHWFEDRGISRDVEERQNLEFLSLRKSSRYIMRENMWEVKCNCFPQTTFLEHDNNN